MRDDEERIEWHRPTAREALAIALLPLAVAGLAIAAYLLSPGR